MKAAIDIGSNSVRMLIGEVDGGQILPGHYYRHITRLAGDYDPCVGISAAARARTLAALEEFAEVLHRVNPIATRAVATEAVRRAVNSQNFVAEVLARTGISVEIVAGEEEARLSADGVLVALVPPPTTALFFDIGGGSTEFIVFAAGKRLWQKSYPLGVVTLAESSAPALTIERVLADLVADLHTVGLYPLLAEENFELVGTAGTVTTLAALDLAMTEYNWQRINNYLLSHAALRLLYKRLLPLTASERESLPGIEKGRGDLIVHGAAIVLALLDLFRQEQLRVSDFGLLEGILLSME